MATSVMTEESYQAHLKKISQEIGRKTGKSTEELYEEREKRVRDTIALREPDRVPVLLGMAYFPGRYTGELPAAAFYDPTAWKDAVTRTVLDFEPDLYRLASGANSGLAMEALDEKQRRWPGGTLSPDTTYQFVEGEYMKEDEYDLFLSDPSDFILRYYLPRVFGVLSPVSKLPPFRNMITSNDFISSTSLFATPEFEQLAQALRRAGEEQRKYNAVASTLQEDLASIGFPPHGHAGGVGGAPFDVISDNLRGMRGAMIDMYRRPEKLLQACEMILQMRIDKALPADPKKRGNPKRLFIPLHRGAEGFMSQKQFETFYWPGLKKALLASIDLGYVPMPFFEGHFGNRLESLLELPKGKVVCHFEHTDMAKAKEILGGHLCVMGNVPSALLQVGSPHEVEEYCRDLIKVCAKGGGFILTNASSIDEAKPANVKAMVDSVKKYGQY